MPGPGTRWTKEEDAYITDGLADQAIVDLTGRTEFAVRDRRRFLHGNREARKHIRMLVHEKEPLFGLKRMTRDTQIPEIILRPWLRRNKNRIVLPLKNGKGEIDWERGWKNRQDYKKVLRVIKEQFDAA